MCKCFVRGWLSVAMETVCSSLPSGRSSNTLEIWAKGKSRQGHRQKVAEMLHLFVKNIISRERFCWRCRPCGLKKSTWIWFQVNRQSSLCWQWWDLMMQDQRVSILPAEHVAPWQKKFCSERESAGSAAVLSAPPPQSPPDLHKIRYNS